jgi:hypothetical protein
MDRYYYSYYYSYLLSLYYHFISLFINLLLLSLKVMGRGIICKDNRYISGHFESIDQVQDATVLDKNLFIYTGAVQNYKKEGEGA